MAIHLGEQRVVLTHADVVARMDLGATLCTPRRPQCTACPMASQCAAKALGTPEAFPVKTRKIRRSAESLWLLLAVSPAAEVLLLQRPQQGIWAGLYCLPVYESEETLRQALPAQARHKLQVLPAFKHVLTHKDLYLHPVALRMNKQKTLGQGRWVDRQSMGEIGLPAPIRKLLGC